MTEAKTESGLGHLNWMVETASKYGVDRRKWPKEAKIKHVDWLDKEGNMGTPSEEAIRDEVYAMRNAAKGGAPRAKRATNNREERDAKRRADRRIAEDKADDQRRKLKACEASISEHERTIENAKAEIKKLRADCKRHKGEIKKLEAKVKRLS